MAALDFPASPTNGQQFSGYTYDASKGAWQWNTIEPSIENLTDTTVGSPANGQLLQYNGSAWVNSANSAAISGNAIINGDFGVWQRGTSFGSGALYFADRWVFNVAGAGTSAITRESFTPGDIESVGYGNAEFFARVNISSAFTDSNFSQSVEDVNTFVGQEATVSFWAKAASPVSLQVRYTQDFGSGGSAANTKSFGTASLTTSWQRFSFVKTMDSVSGKTIGANNKLILTFVTGANVNTLDVWGVQVEAGPVATPFRLAGGGSKAAELALCHRYYQTIEHIQIFAMAAPYADSNGIHTTSWQFPYGKMRAVPSLLYQDELGNSERFSIQRNNQNNFAQDNINLRPFGGAVTTELVRTFSLYNETSGFSSTGDFGLAKALNVRLDAEL